MSEFPPNLTYGYIPSAAEWNGFLSTMQPLPGPPPNPGIGQCYFDLTLGYPLIFCADLKWHGFQLS